MGAAIRAVVYVAAAGAFQMAVSPRNRAAIAESVPWLPALLWTALGVFCVCSIVWPLIAVPRRGYVVREKDLLYKSGVLWRSVKAFPFNRVQHTKLHSTPLDRRFGLASLSVFPAGGGLGNRVRGVGRETAERLRVYISERIEVRGARRGFRRTPPKPRGTPAGESARTPAIGSAPPPSPFSSSPETSSGSWRER